MTTSIPSVVSPGEVTLRLLHIDVTRLCIMVANSTNMIKPSHKAVLEDLSKWNYDGASNRGYIYQTHIIIEIIHYPPYSMQYLFKFHQILKSIKLEKIRQVIFQTGFILSSKTWKQYTHTTKGKDDQSMHLWSCVRETMFTTFNQGQPVFNNYVAEQDYLFLIKSQN